MMVLSFSHFLVSGEDWVLAALKNAFPSNSKVALTGAGGCGDIMFGINGKRIMFEVKNYASGRTVKGQGKGKELEKFFTDAEQTKLERR